jgi:hypothetical protein
MSERSAFDLLSYSIIKEAKSLWLPILLVQAISFSEKDFSNRENLTALPERGG